MGIRIHQLPTAIANQIAAGEVIERPASVVKELLENSLDAGATSISVEIGYGGLNQIKISDNGIGIHADDLPLAIAAHATSKITTLNDLYAIDSMGFRGEALASISSVAKVKISSRPEDQEHAMMLQVQDGSVTLIPCARNVGTTIDVCDLFYNAPVRKRFLKNEKLEFQSIEMVVKRFALSAPHIALSLKHNNKPALNLPAALNEHAKQTRMLRIFGSSFLNDAISIDVEHAGMRLNGWISGPQYQRSQNDRQWVYINQRMVKDKLIHHALRQAYEEWLHPGRFPACLLYFTINHGEVDVNVHPTKHEVRFQQPRLVHDFFTSQLGAALKSVGRGKAEDVYEYSAGNPERKSVDVSEPYSKMDEYFSPRPAKREVNSGLGDTLTSDVENRWVILNDHYVLAFLNHQPHIVDVLKVHQHWLTHQLSQMNLPLAQRPLLVPVSILLPAPLKNHINVLPELLLQLGITIKITDADDLQIRSIPVCMPNLDISLFFELLAKMPPLDLESLIAIAVQAHYVSPANLSREERTELSRFLIQMQTEQPELAGISKAITRDECRKLVHV